LAIERFVYHGLFHQDGPAFLNLFHFPAVHRSLTNQQLTAIFHRMRFSATSLRSPN
jgi:hypothetical protein